MSCPTQLQGMIEGEGCAQRAHDITRAREAAANLSSICSRASGDSDASSGAFEAFGGAGDGAGAALESGVAADAVGAAEGGAKV